MKKLYYLFLITLFIPLNVYADEARNISNGANYKLNDTAVSKLKDNNVKTNISLKQDDKLTISSNEDKISHIYIVYEITSKTGTLITDGEEQEIGADGFLHEYVKLTIPSNTITLTYNEDVKISEISIYSEGDIPSDVQIWKKEDKTDLMIFSTHADDEQLFFAGVMPTYINKGKKVHVVYLARHDVGSYYNPSRMHEQLNGLWALGVTDYPTFGLIPDAYSTTLETAESQMKNAGFTLDDIIAFDVKQIRKYQPKVILGHDENGEYGHGQHRLNTYTLKTAIIKAEDETYEIDGLSAIEIPKVYLHLYNPDNYTVLDYDIPLENYGGKTAYEISKEGYSKHLSQQYTWFTNWLNGKNNSYTSAKQITKYNPMYWGLYHTNVGPDVNKNDLFENIPEEKEDIIENNEQDVKPKKKITKKLNKYEKIWNKIKNNKKIVIISLSTILIFGTIIIAIKKIKASK